MKDLFSLDGKVAVVTGACGLLGQHFCSGLADFGARIAAWDVASEPRSPTHAQWSSMVESGKLRLFKVDITNRASVEKGLADVQAWAGTPDVLVNSAAIDSPPDAPASENGPFETYPEASWDRVVHVNLKGTLVPCQVVGGAMALRGSGSIINVSSIYGVVSPNQDIYEYRRKQGEDWYKPVAYSVTKSGILNLTRYLATYWGRKGVRVNTMTPAGVFNGQDENFLAEYTKRVPMGRMARSEELTGAVVFLASGASSYVTGANLMIDGGWTAW